MMFVPHQRSQSIQSPQGERGWALLGLLLTLTIMGIFMASTVAPNVGTQVQRSKEEELFFRGEQMARGIARYYGNGNLVGINLRARQLPLGFLTELKKLRDGFMIGVKEVKLVRPSAMIDPMTSQEWEPVRARDPRIMKVLQAWAVESQQPIPQSYLEIAAAPQRMVLAPGAGGNKDSKPKGDPNNPDPNDPDPNDPDPPDPLAHIFGSDSGGPGNSNAPIVGVAPKRKGKALRPLYGLEYYEEWVFIYLPPFNQQSGSKPLS